MPNAVFKCLEVIGKHREQGLIQPKLTKITGQDKKSIAGRTALLKEMGYIEKVAVLAKNMNTSKLTLTKFARQRDKQLAQDHKDDSGKKGKSASGKSSERWTGETIHLEGLIRAIIAELKNAKNGVVQRGDLKKKLVRIAVSNWHGYRTLISFRVWTAPGSTGVLFPGSSGKLNYSVCGEGFEFHCLIIAAMTRREGAL